MTHPYTPVPDTRAIGTGNPAADMDSTADELADMGGSFNVLDASFAGGADPTGGTPCDAVVAAAIAALPAAGGAVIFPPGTYKMTSGVTVTQAGIYLSALIPGTVTINYTGSGACVRMYTTSSYAPGNVIGGGVIGGIIFDGTSASAGACAIHAGDIYRMRWDCAARNFQGTGSKGFWFDNNYHWGEQWTGQIWAEQCSTHVQFDNSTDTSGVSTGSFDRACLDIFLDAKGKGNCVIFANGACIHDGRLGILGNTDYGASLFYVLTLTGSDSSGYSRLVNCILSIGVECNGTSGTQPGSINFVSAGNNVITGCSGVVDFSANNAFAAANNFLSSFQFDGPVLGTMLRSLGVGTNVYQFGAISNGSTINTRFLSVVKVTNTGSVTGVILQGFNPDGARLLTVINKGSGTVTFAASGTSHVADGTSDVIQANSAAMYVWDSNDVLWYRI